MRNKFKKAAVGAMALILLCGGLCFAACGSSYSLDDLSEDTVAAIKSAYFEQYYGSDHTNCEIEGITISQYLGAYGGHIVVALSDHAKEGVDAPTVVVNVTVDGVYIGDLPDPSYAFVVYIDPSAKYESAILRLADAYEQGFITKADLRRIASVAEKY